MYSSTIFEYISAKVFKILFKYSTVLKRTFKCDVLINTANSD